MPEVIPAPSQTWSGSKPEWNIFYSLVKLGLKASADFTYQSAREGGRLELGGAVVDFVVYKAAVAINVMSLHWHYASPSRLLRDVATRSLLERFGLVMIYIDEEHALKNPMYYTQEALAGRDHSMMKGVA